MKTIKRALHNELRIELELLKKEEGDNRLLSNFIIQLDGKFIDSSKTIKGITNKFEYFRNKYNLKIVED